MLVQEYILKHIDKDNISADQNILTLKSVLLNISSYNIGKEKIINNDNSSFLSITNVNLNGFIFHTNDIVNISFKIYDSILSELTDTISLDTSVFNYQNNKNKFIKDISITYDDGNNDYIILYYFHYSLL